MRSKVIAMLAVLLPTASAVAADAVKSGDGLLRRHFGAWLVVCGATGDPSCSATSQGTGEVGGRAAADRLRVVRTGTGSDPELMLLPAGDASVGEPFAVIIDRKAAVIVNPSAEFHPAAAPERGVIVEPAVAGRLVAAMRAGVHVKIRYLDASGHARQASFSLRGLSAALAFIERVQSGRATVPGAAFDVPQGAPDQGDWSRDLGRFLPMIAACLDESSAPRPLRVVAAWDYDSGHVAIALQADTAPAAVCVAALRGGARPVIREARDGELPLVSSPIFTPHGQPPPGGECYEHEDAKDDSGAVIGTLSYDTC